MQPPAFVCFDLETTGCNPSKDGIIQLAAMTLTLAKEGTAAFVKSSSFSCYARNEVPIHFRAVQTHGLTEKRLKELGAVDPREMLRSFVEYLNRQEAVVLVAYSSGLDFNFLAQSMDRYSLVMGNIRGVVNALGLVRKAYPTNTHRLGVLFGDLVHRCDTTCTAENCEWASLCAHDAMSDTRMLVELMEKPTMAQMLQLESNHQPWQRWLDRVTSRKKRN